MKTLTLNVCRIIMLTFILYSCARNSDTDSESVAIDNNEYYVDSSGKYLIELGDDGYNIYMDVVCNFTKTYRLKITKKGN